MSVKYRVWKVRRDGVSQRYRVASTSEHDSAVVGVVSGDLATTESRREQELARQILQSPSVQESVYRLLMRQYEEIGTSYAKPMSFLQHYLSRGYPEAEALLVRLAIEPSNRHVRRAAIETIATSTNPRVPRLIREVIDKAPDEETTRHAIFYLATYLNDTMQNLMTQGITPAREAVLDALETLGLAMQGKWFEPKGEISNILNALKYKRSEFEQAAQGQIPARVEKQVIDGLMSVLSLGDLANEAFKQMLGVVEKWGSEYALSKLRSLWSGLSSKRRRDMVFDAMNEIEHQLKRKSG